MSEINVIAYSGLSRQLLPCGSDEYISPDHQQANNSAQVLTGTNSRHFYIFGQENCQNFLVRKTLPTHLSLSFGQPKLFFTVVYLLKLGQSSAG